jgi:hypothetical protein
VNADAAVGLADLEPVAVVLDLLNRSGPIGGLSVTVALLRSRGEKGRSGAIVINLADTDYPNPRLFTCPVSAGWRP